MIKEISKELNNFNVAPTIHQNVIVVLFLSADKLRDSAHDISISGEIQNMPPRL